MVSVNITYENGGEKMLWGKKTNPVKIQRLHKTWTLLDGNIPGQSLMVEISLLVDFHNNFHKIERKKTLKAEMP